MTDTSNGNTWEQEPIVSIRTTGDDKKITGVGADARLTGDEIINPFDHPRILISDFSTAEKLLQYVIRSLAKIKWIAPAPVIILQVKEKLEGGLSSIEHRALMEMAFGVGAREVYISTLRELSNAEIRNGTYKNETQQVRQY